MHTHENLHKISGRYYITWSIAIDSRLKIIVGLYEEVTSTIIRVRSLNLTCKKKLNWWTCWETVERGHRDCSKLSSHHSCREWVMFHPLYVAKQRKLGILLIIDEYGMYSTLSHSCYVKTQSSQASFAGESALDPELKLSLGRCTNCL